MDSLLDALKSSFTYVYFRNGKDLKSYAKTIEYQVVYLISIFYGQIIKFMENKFAKHLKILVGHSFRQTNKHISRNMCRKSFYIISGPTMQERVHKQKVKEKKKKKQDFPGLVILECTTCLDL